MKKPEPTFHDLFQSARRSPIYWLYGLELDFERWISVYRKQTKTLTVVGGREKRDELEAKIAGITRCLREVRAEQRRFEALPENQKLNRRKRREQR